MRLQGKRIAVLAEDVYEDLELWYPYYRLQEEGADVVLLGTGRPEYQSKHGVPVKVDAAAGEVEAGGFDAVVVPGGYAPDRMRRHRPMVDLVKSVFEGGGIVSFICHAGWVPISADIVRDHRVTSAPSIRDDLGNAGAHWVDEAVVHDGNLISSRRPPDLPAFCRTLIDALAGT